MLSGKEKLEADILAIISDSPQAVGCGAISAVLRDRGIIVSEATVGRLLRDLDRQGYTLKAGFQGRVLSASGKERLRELANKDKSLKWSADFIRVVQGHTKEQLLEVLVARRAIESELAALAAVNGSPQEMRTVKEILERQKAAVGRGEGSAQEDVEFHAMIAAMAGNRVLAAAIGLIRHDTQLSPVLEYIRRTVLSSMYIDHQKIYNAIADRNAEAARLAMVEHINNIIADVNKYWEKSATAADE